MTSNRWINILGAVLVLLCTGSIYAFSVFSGPLALVRGWTPEQVALAFTISTAVCPIPMIIAGKIVDRGYARTAMLLGGASFGLAFLMMDWFSSLTALYLGYGVLGGVGISFAYAGALGNATRYFPDKRGMATGLVTAGNGAAALITAPLLNTLISQHGVLSALHTVGIGFVVVAVVCGIVCRSAPNDYRPAGWTPPVSSNSTNASLNWKTMLCSPMFYLMLTLMAAGALSGLMIAANASPIGQSMFALSASAAALYVGLYAASNAAGRFIWGAVSDRIGGANALVIIFTLIALMLLLLATTTHAMGFVIALCGIGIAFGGVMGVFPALVSQRFGARYFGVNYGIMFCGYAIAAAIGPRLGASVAAANGGDFSQAFYIALAICVIGAALAVLLSRRLARWKLATA
ncbi:MFS permease-like protein [Pseudomonas fluorescens]|uniref:MFS permease-like protein n=1 Tax=Pseudomonas fluorescens TaxID=294 RepID=A0A379IFE5_PSEFL|nr:OFA family MFS transporter [Pseudomonas fluorescens]SUD31456.1 MFS permease-like protein [Pseudomonas fluorescens]